MSLRCSADEMNRLACDWDLEPTANLPAEREHVSRLCEQRRLFTAAACEHLNGLSRPTA